MASLKKFIVNMAQTIKNKQGRPFTIIVEGNIGCGKTTFLNHFKRYDNLCILAEPIELWRGCNGHNLLNLMYEDPHKWGFSFQSYVQLTMLQHHAMKTESSVKLMERSIYSARYCFVEKMTQDGLISKPSSAVIDEWFQWITKNGLVDVDLIVYLRSTPEVVYERMMKRNRSEERAIPLQYLKDLHEIHENWLHYKTLHSLPAPVITINADLDRSCIEEEYEKCEPHILENLALKNIA